MKGRILDFDLRRGEGLISGDDGGRYRFVIAEWNADTVPLKNQAVDFEAAEGEALQIYKIGSASSGSVAGEKNKIVAAILAFFLGVFGAHKFYLGYNGAGAAMLLITLFSWVLLFVPLFVISLIAFIEFIIYLVTPDAEFEERYVLNKRAWF